jgi:hypothetical protein
MDVGVVLLNRFINQGRKGAMHCDPTIVGKKRFAIAGSRLPDAFPYTGTV